MAAALIFRALGRGKKAMLVSGIVGEAIMVVGYFFYASLILGKGLAAAASIPGNIVQGIAGIAIGMGAGCGPAKDQVQRAQRIQRVKNQEQPCEETSHGFLSVY